MIRYLGSVIILCAPLALFAQDNATPRDVSGVVYAAKDGSVVPGATIRIKGTRKGVTTDGQGKFRLLARPGDTLLISAIGFLKLERPCGQQPLLELTLPEDNQKLNEVMVIGYGDEKKRNITGSITSVDANELSRSSAISFDNALAGKAAGVDVLSSSGVPGSATAITIRGISTLNADGNHPLIVIDGIPVYGSGKEQNTSNFRASTSPLISTGSTYVSDDLTPEQAFENNPLASLNPNDIASIEILKDAYATAIYGSRGATGVILITTKKGTKGKPQFNLRYVTGTVQPIAAYPLLNGAQYNAIYTAYYKERGSNKPFTSPYDTDWQKAVTRTAIMQNADLSMSAGNDKARYYISGSYTSQPSYIINNDYKRYSGRINLEYQASQAFTMGALMNASYTNNTSMNAAAIYREALLKAPNLPVYEADGSYAYGRGSNPFGETDSNPVADARENTNYLQTYQTLGNAYLQFKPVEWLLLRSEFGTEITSGHAYTRRVLRPSGFGDDAVESTSQNRKIVVNNTLTVTRSLAGMHYINAVAGQSFERSTETNTSIGGYGFPNDAIKSIAAAEHTYISAALTQQWALVSYFARLNYAYDNKYLAGITYRLDGSSRFGRNQRYVGFPSFSAGWRISKEPFLQSYGWIDDIKLRASIGFSGNSNSTSYYGNQGQYKLNSNGINYAGVPILQIQQPENPNLKWERTLSTDIGLDAGFRNNRLTVTVDYYEKRIRNMIMSSLIPLYQGWASQPQNIGDMVNRGLELSLNAELLQYKGFYWSARFNISANRNKILRLNYEGEEVRTSADAFKYFKVGHPAGEFYLYEWAGVNSNTGDPLWVDDKGGISNIPPASRFREVEDVNVFRKLYGTSQPDLFGGMGHNFRYRNWELDAFFSFSAGGKMINGAKAALLTYATEDAHNLHTDILDHWIIPGQETAIPRLVNSSILVPAGSSSSMRDYTTSRTNSRFLENASYLRLRTITLTYNITPAQLPAAVGKTLRSLQLFARATNLFTLTSYSGIDPELSAFGSSALNAGYDELTMPQNKMYQIGINLGL